MVLSDFQSIRPNLSYYVKHTFHFHFFVYFYFVCFCSGFTFFPPISRGISLIWLNRNMKNMRKPRLRHSKTILGMILSKKIKGNPKILRWYQQNTHFLQFQPWRLKINTNFTLTSLIFINKNMKTLLKTNPGQS